MYVSNHAYVNKSRHKYACDVNQLSDPDTVNCQNIMEIIVHEN